jgi:hypothetical protein
MPPSNFGLLPARRHLVGAQIRDGFARTLVNRPASFPGAPLKPFHGAGDERIVVVRFYRRVTNLSEGQEVEPSRGSPEMQTTRGIDDALPAPLDIAGARMDVAAAVQVFDERVGRGVLWSSSRQR